MFADRHYHDPLMIFFKKNNAFLTTPVGTDSFLSLRYPIPTREDGFNFLPDSLV